MHLLITAFNGTPLQYSCLENPMDGGAWKAAVHGIVESDMTERLHFPFSLSCIGEGNGNPLQCSCLENPRDGGAGWAAVYGVGQSWTRLKRLSSSSSSSQSLEKALAPHSSVLVWRIPGRGVPGGLPSMGSHRVGHDWSDLAAAATATLVLAQLTFLIMRPKSLHSFAPLFCLLLHNFFCICSSKFFLLLIWF